MSFDVIDAVNARLAAASQSSENVVGAAKGGENILSKFCVETTIENDAKCYSAAGGSNKLLSNHDNVRIKL